MDGDRPSGIPPGGKGSERAGRNREENFAEISGGATFVTAELLGLAAALAYWGMGRGMGGTSGLELGVAAPGPAGFSAVDCGPESGAAFFSLGTISAMLSLRTEANP
jgi:hypothetical protein